MDSLNENLNDHDTELFKKEENINDNTHSKCIEFNYNKKNDINDISNSKFIKYNDTIIIATNKNNVMKFVKIQPGKTVKIFKTAISTDSFLHFQLGSVLEFDRGKLNLVDPLIFEKDYEDLISPCEDTNNSELFDDGKSQQLSKEEIEDLKQTLSGNEIVDQIVKKSSTFKNKTLFSQQKYIKKKKFKHCNYIKLLPVSVNNVITMALFHFPQRIKNIRIDTFSQIMSLANLHVGGKYLVIDQICGLLLAGIYERFQDNLHIMNIYFGETPDLSLFKNFSFTSDIHSKIKCIPFTSLISSKNSFFHSEASQPIDSLYLSTNNSISNKEIMIPHTHNGIQILGSNIDDDQKISQILKETIPFDSLIIASSYNLEEYIISILSFLQPGSTFLIYSEILSPLIRLQYLIRGQGIAIKCEIYESWLREYQVLSYRTHPINNMNTQGGYYLAGLYIPSKRSLETDN